MFKEYLFKIIIILTLLVVGPKEQYGIFIAEQDDAIEWNNYEIEETLL